MGVRRGKFYFRRNYSIFDRKTGRSNPEALFLLSVGCSPTVFAEYITLDIFISFQSFTVEVLRPWGSVRGIFVLVKLLDFNMEYWP